MKVYTVAEVMRMLKVRKSYVYELIYTGRLRAAKLSERRLRITEEALREFLEAQTRRQ
ncbi:MAG: helix-turn-helix domain-containing protein [Bacillota bacterium]